ncbi:MAG: rod shape-determining protein RodA [Bacteroidaceae bacterium]|nr:rod shape-determining protein RodA [Bacteroidaceae bacterium]MBQ4621221.1 rod shape-determining protein RodA [Bacteroidaceae bacterium]MBQ6799890.1 rod shape-determining protein RodA [Bacteroidaceae bacterium]MBR6590661.1 rod shape-determining protein RodA [Bacteroidaceae bacterium]
MRKRKENVWKSIDWITVLLYLVLVTCGWFSICGASYTYGETDLFSFDSRSGKQLVWIGCSMGLGFVLLMLEEKIYEVLAYLFYAAMMLLLLVTPFIARDIKGSLSWISLGPVSLQPAEFAKYATALALAKMMSSYGFTLDKGKNFIRAIFLILLPMILIIMQKETGSALVYAAFFLVLYREGMSGAILFTGVAAVIYFVVGIRFGNEFLWDTPTSVGRSVVLTLILLFSIGMTWVYGKLWKPVKWMLILSITTTAAGILLSEFIYAFDLTYLLVSECIVMAGYLIYLAIMKRSKQFALIALFTIGSVAFLYSCNMVFNKLDDHQRVRIEVLLGMKDDPKGAGYNVNQSKIAIGSGGLHGKGFLNGTQTKLKYVPEQDTDFIFCTVGEEMGFIGSSAILFLFMLFILRLLHLAEKQSHAFGRIYGYCLVSIFLFHLFINVGMVLGLTPVIGIPLPFFSYGGSSLWGFTLLLFTFLRVNAEYNKKK